MKRLINYHIYGIVRMLLFALACTSVSFAYADDLVSGQRRAWIRVSGRSLV